MKGAASDSVCVCVCGGGRRVEENKTIATSNDEATAVATTKPVAATATLKMMM